MDAALSNSKPSKTAASANAFGTDVGKGTIHTPEEVPVGTHIIHPKLGEGVVVKLDFVMGEGVVTVRFAQAGDKKLYLRFAQFDIK